MTDSNSNQHVADCTLPPVVLPKIKSAAILHRGVIYTGPSHCEIGLAMLADNVCRRPFPGGRDQGFVMEDGRFVSRKEARTIAVDAGQVDPKWTMHQTMLFSEDLRGIRRQNPSFQGTTHEPTKED